MFLQIKITAKIFPATPEEILYSLNLNSLHKNTVPRNRFCSITTGLFFSETNTDAHLVLFENMYFCCTYSIKTKILSMLGTGYFLKSQKLIPSSKNQSVLIAKISSPQNTKNRKSAKTNSCKNFVPHGIRWKNDRLFDQPGPGRYFWFLTCVSSGLLDYPCNHQLCL